MDPTYPLIPIVNFIVCLLVLSSLSRAMFQSWNVGAFSFAFWVAVESFIRAINSIVWSDNVENKAPIWCDIITHLDVGSFVGIPMSSLVIIRRLSLAIFKVKRPSPKKEMSDLVVDLFLCVGIPVIQMVVYYIVQSVRFRIIEEFGCVSYSESFGLEVLLLDLMPLIPPVISLTCYSPRLIKAYRRTREMNKVLADSSAPNRHAFIKLLALGLFDIFITLPLMLIPLVQDLENVGPKFWPGWGVVHTDLHDIPTTTSEQLKMGGFWAIFNVKVYEWFGLVLALPFFLLFGLTEQKRALYYGFFSKAVKSIGFKGHVSPVVSNIVFHSGRANYPAFDVTPTANPSPNVPEPVLTRPWDRCLDTEEARQISSSTANPLVSTCSF